MKIKFSIIFTVACAFIFLCGTICFAESLRSNKNMTVTKAQLAQKKSCAGIKENKGLSKDQIKKECLKNLKKVENLSGLWKTSFADLSLLQTGNNVTGTYNYKGGKLEGTITGNRLDYSWSQDNGKKGKGFFIISEDWQTITGKYGYDNSTTSGGKWSGKKSTCPAISNDPSKETP